MIKPSKYKDFLVGRFGFSNFSINQVQRIRNEEAWYLNYICNLKLNKYKFLIISKNSSVLRFPVEQVLLLSSSKIHALYVHKKKQIWGVVWVWPDLDDSFQ